MSNELTNFENQYMPTMANYALLDQQLKQAKAKHDEMKGKLETAMEEYGIKSIDNDYLKITRVEASESTSVDLKAMQKAEPVEYAELLEDYPKVTKRKASIRITVKNNV
ncbi:hypothetical protein [Marinilactibacillus psychrotolerans]|uniref:Uncharacterized protein n=1 Tax=Marinilactibacillus psychrotolerans TaxID=191770 RepID=A0AAV3W9E4_9LACT|nr:hypothetical protein [Marinilactibacillus psychrotolerans]GEL67222.1 hypothetical protein MPS01_13770 [Marinilactibacillus psychrotolerans]GEQ36026.1 hypothetical protein M132T_15340 [Marinilactibacillus psychrotolerans]SDC60330.1 hypothetical protein SAMN04488013_10738 [Marinilactibacillus psychrotolerans]